MYIRLSMSLYSAQGHSQANFFLFVTLTVTFSPPFFIYETLYFCSADINSGACPTDACPGHGRDLPRTEGGTAVQCFISHFTFCFKSRYQLGIIICAPKKLLTSPHKKEKNTKQANSLSRISDFMK